MRNLISRFVDSNERAVKHLQPIVDETNSLEPEFEALSDDEIRQRMIELGEQIRADSASTEPSEDELNNESSERRRELRRARQKEDTQQAYSAAQYMIARRQGRQGCLSFAPSQRML